MKESVWALDFSGDFFYNKSIRITMVPESEKKKNKIHK